MEYRLLGRTGVKVSRLCFGTMATDRTEQLAGFADKPGAVDPGGPPDTGPRH